MQIKSNEEIDKNLEETMEQIYSKLEQDKKKAEGWQTPYGFCDFKKPVTYAEACKFMEEEVAKIFR